ncbi:MAG: hypothetical protein K8R73_00235 [Clostridiales bacterium]|nr:hypothetical protein [Clostridiales bacterium]
MENGYIKALGISYSGTIPKIKKKDKRPLQPIFEAFTNSLESIKLKRRDVNSDNGIITIRIYKSKNLLSNETKAYNFQKIQIIDTGIGFNDDEFNRLISLNDDGKGFSNRGCGRIQFLHYFDKTECRSIYKDESSNTGFKFRRFVLSKSNSFLEKNAIIRLDEEKEIDSKDSGSTITFDTLLSDKDESYYKELTPEELKENLLNRYLSYFCENRNDLPKIIIKSIIDNKESPDLEIISSDIPLPDKEESIEVHYSKVNGKNIEFADEKETFFLKSFKIPMDDLERNELKLTSKGEIAKDVRLESLLSEDNVNGNRFLFLLSGDYINNRDSDTRGEINILRKDDFKKINSEALFTQDEILLEDIEEKTNKVIIELYEEIRNKNDEKNENVEKLKKMFLLNQETLDSMKINISDTDSSILQKVYQSDAKLIARRDAEIKHRLKEVEDLNTTDPDYLDSLKSHVDELVKSIPLQNRTSLTHYVARRKIVLELFGKILKQQLEIQSEGNRNIDEKLLHNLIFQQSADNPEESDLWLINEDFIYFQGTSESRLTDVSIDGIKLMKDEFSQEETDYKNSLNEIRDTKKPDVLLFPDEGKCIIIEFKNPNVNVSDHISQINQYASIIRNLSKDEFHFDTFYGYLIGEKIDADDIIDKDPYFVKSYNLDYVFRPHYPVRGKFGKTDGSLYTESIKYSTLLERSILRNSIFIEKLTRPSK